MRAFLICLSLLPTALPLRGQTVPLVVLGKRTARTPSSMGNVVNVAELRDGRVVAGDAKERIFQLVDFSHGDMAPIGGPGDGPYDYNIVGQAFGWLGDSALLYVGDHDHPRYLHLTPEGVIVGVSSVATAAPDPMQEHGSYSVAGPYAVDSSEASYFLLTLVDSTSTSYPLGDMIRVPADGRNRTVVDYLRQRRDNQGLTRRAPGFMIRPYPFRDAWAQRSDGLAARVVADTYEVVWSRNGQVVGRTGALSSTPIPVTESEQSAFRDSIIGLFNPAPAADGGNGKQVASSSGGGGSGSSASSGATTGDNRPRSFTPPAATATLRIPDFAPFPDRKPALPAGRSLQTAMFDPAGDLWVNRERAHGDNIPHVDIIREGKGIIGRVDLPKSTRVVGFGANSVYLVYHDDNGDWLERYPRPTF
jgi:hypothetical protein